MPADSPDTGAGTIQQTWLTIRYKNVRHNERITFYVITTAGLRRFFTVKFSKKDLCLYVIFPRVPGGAVFDNQFVQPISLPAQAGESVRVSFHRSGVVNIHQGHEQTRARRQRAENKATGRIGTLTLRNPLVLPIASPDEINSKSGTKEKVAPVFGLPEAYPIHISVFRFPKSEQWSMPHPGNTSTLLMHAGIEIPLLEQTFHFLVFSDPSIPTGNMPNTFVEFRFDDSNNRMGMQDPGGPLS